MNPTKQMELLLLLHRHNFHENYKVKKFHHVISLDFIWLEDVKMYLKLIVNFIV